VIAADGGKRGVARGAGRHRTAAVIIAVDRDGPAGRRAEAVMTNGGEERAAWRRTLHEVIFEAETPAGKVFDVLLLVAIVLSVAAVVLESVPEVRARYGTMLRVAEWCFTLLFSAEYLLRLISVRRPWRYASSFFGIVDLLAVLPTYLSFAIAGAQSLLVLRALRLLRIFRVFKVTRYLHEVTALVDAIRATRAKITVFLLAVLTMVLVLGALMYVIEGERGDFHSIPRGMYWAVVTVTTVGYGDIAPRTVFGRMVAAAAMVLGYSLIIIPTGIFSMELVRAAGRKVTTQSCPECVREGHDPDAVHCKYCGAEL
jgi:voltage-gated potassium channel